MWWSTGNWIKILIWRCPRQPRFRILWGIQVQSLVRNYVWILCRKITYIICHTFLTRMVIIPQTSKYWNGRCWRLQVEISSQVVLSGISIFHSLITTDSVKSSRDPIQLNYSVRTADDSFYLLDLTYLAFMFVNSVVLFSICILNELLFTCLLSTLGRDTVIQLR